MAALLPLLASLPAAAAAPPGLLVLPDFSALEHDAIQSVNVSLGPTMLGLAAGVMSADPRSEDAAIKQLIAGLQGIYVRSYTFDRSGAYSRADVQAVRSQLTAPAWQPIVSAHDRTQDSDTDIYVRRTGARTDGIAIISAQPRQLTIVNIVGSIDLAKLAQLQGHFGVPGLSGIVPGFGAAPAPQAQARSHALPDQRAAGAPPQ